MYTCTKYEFSEEVVKITADYKKHNSYDIVV